MFILHIIIAVLLAGWLFKAYKNGEGQDKLIPKAAIAFITFVLSLFLLKLILILLALCILVALIAHLFFEKKKEDFLKWKAELLTAIKEKINVFK